VQRDCEVQGRGHVALSGADPSTAQRRQRRALIAGAGLALLLVSGCGGGDDDGGNGGSSGTPASQADQIAAGREVYTAECAQCHGANGEGGTGPLLIGGNKRIASYQTTQRLYDYVSTTMPFDEPGSLTQEQYWNVISYLLDANELLPPDTVLGPGAEPIELKRE
jgi:mono/diheme cytochrome c family protein